MPGKEIHMKYKWIKKYENEIEKCNIKSPDRKNIFLKQYAEKGYCDIDLWCLATSTAEFILPRLKEFRDRIVAKDTCGNYGSLADYDAMIYSFQMIVDNDHLYVKQSKKLKIEKGLKLFAEQLTGMWY